MSAIIFYSAQIGKSCRKLISLSKTGIKAVCSGVDPVPSGTDLVFRWGCTGRTYKKAKFVNTRASIDWCCDKKAARLAMQAAGVPVPQTWKSVIDFIRDDEVIGMLEQGWCFKGDKKYVVRPEHHTQGKELYVLEYPDQIDSLLPAGLRANCYISAFIDKVAEYRVFVVSNRVAWVNKTEAPEDGRTAWNYAAGENVMWGDWPLNVATAALAAAKVSGTDFCAVDLMVDAEGNAFVSECNSAPSQEGTYHPSCVAKCFDYIVANGKDKFDDPVLPAGTAEDRAWRWFIHPAVWSAS